MLNPCKSCLYSTKAIRQRARLGMWVQRLGISSRFPIPPVINPESPLFLVGSGASVLDINVDKQMGEAISISINDAIFLSEKFKIHSYEISKDRTWRPFIDERISDIMRSEDLRVISSLSSIKRPFEKPSFFSNYPSRISLWSSINAEKEDLRKQMSWYLSLSVPSETPGPDPNFSLGRLLVKAIKLGYRDIRLAGVDLFTAEHFWQHSEDHSWIKEIHEKSRGLDIRQPHKTNMGSNKWPAFEFLEAVRDLTSHTGVNISTHKSSPLSDYFATWS